MKRRKRAPKPAPPPEGGPARRAHGGCLGTGRRRRAREAAIVPGEPHSGFDPGVPEWGNPTGEGLSPAMRGATGGTETSKYPEEGKSTETAGVEAIGTAPAQTGGSVTACARCAAGVEGARSRGRTPRGGVTKRQASGRTWEGPPQRVRAPYAEPAASPRAAPSTAGHEEPGGKQGGPPSKAKHVPVTDSGRVP